ncbi:MAG: T9SS type A sorting domain-containing protein [Bacteroidia bacterium]|nr:T9SS type A sorting domain-containing protein [Bacteroidia bacterium]
MRNFTTAALWAALTLLLYGGSSYATHFTSLEVWHQDLGNGQYRLFSAQYLDCSGAASVSYFPIGSTSLLPLPPTYSATSSAGCSFMVDTAWQVVSFIEVTPLCPTLFTSCTNPGSPVSGIAYIKHKEVIQVTNCNPTIPNPVLNLTFSNCCRASSITSLINPGTTGIFLDHPIFVGVTNSNPDLLPLPLSLCDGQSSSFFVGGTDPDGDSLQYLLVPAMDVAGIQVQYLPGYSFFNPMGPGWTVSLDPQTGILSVSANPGGFVNAVIKILVEEYRNGMLVGKTERDLFLTVQQCSSNLPPSINGISNLSGGVMASPNVIDFCAGGIVQFDLTFSDPNQAQALSVTHSILTALPGATVTTSGANTLTLSVSWTPTAADTSLKAFFVSVTDGACPIPGITSDLFYVSPTGTCIIPTIVNSICQDSIGSISIHVLGAPGPFSYVWNTGATDSLITGLPPGTYWVTAFDSTTSKTFTDTFLITAQDILLNTSVIQPDCSLPTGSIYAQASGGTLPYTYLWSNGSTADSLTGLPPGGYSVIVEDSVGCFQQATVILSPTDSCFVTISGRVYHDVNTDCLGDSSEFGLEGVLINYSPGGMVLTDSNGVFSFKADTGLVYLEVFSSYLNNLVCPASYTVYNAQYGIDTSGFDFGVDTLLYHDLEVSVSCTPPVWNSTVKYYVTALNNGMLVSKSALKTLTYPAGLTPISYAPAPVAVDLLNHTVTWDTGTLLPTQQMTCFAYFAVGSSINLGDTIVAQASITVILGETDTVNNHDSYAAEVVASYDPNDKQVTPTGIGEPGFILPSTPTLDYRIRFQNTGNYPASYVVLRDTLPAHLDLSQYRTLGASHRFRMAVEEDSIMVFTFANINLPAEMDDPAGSQGFVAFQLGLYPNLPIGTEITNSAAIYFDFNPPIYTNSTLNTIYTQPEVVLQPLPFYCEGDLLVADIVATGMAPYTYEWNVGNTVVSPSLSDAKAISQSGWYVVTVTDDFGFTSSDSVFVNAVPKVKAEFNWNLTGNGFEIAFTDNSSGANDYFWYFQNGITSTLQNPVITFPKAGMYEATQVARNECWADTLTLFLDLRNDGIETWPYSPIVVTPNPFEEFTEVTFPDVGEWTAIVYDLQGRRLFQQPVRGNSLRINRGQLSSGIYTLEVSHGHYRQQIKLMIRE